MHHGGLKSTPLPYTRLSHPVYLLAALIALITTYHYSMRNPQLQVRGWGASVGVAGEVGKVYRWREGDRVSRWGGKNRLGGARDVG
jgi:hypothetical protein